MAATSLAAQRRQQILDEVRAHGAVHTADLTRRLGVSEMTVHRDLDRLAAEELARKVFGGTMAVQPAEAQSCCAACGAAPEKRLDFTAHLADGDRCVSCWPHGGLLLVHRLGEQVQSTITFDFVARQPVNARAAVFVLASVAIPYGRPSLLAFGRREDAERFQAGFGWAPGHLRGGAGVTDRNGLDGRKGREPCRACSSSMTTPR